MTTPRTCTGEDVPLVQLSLERKKCLRRAGAKFNSPAAIAQQLQKYFGCEPQEHFFVVSLSSNNEIVGIHEVALGGLSSAPADPRVVWAGALLSRATAIILAHNHPSGSPEPSNDDIQLTRHFVQAGELLGIRVLDHLIIPRGGGYLSFAERGLMPQVGAPRLSGNELRYEVSR